MVLNDFREILSIYPRNMVLNDFREILSIYPNYISFSITVTYPFYDLG